MILSASQSSGAGRVTLDQLVQHNAQRRPEALALVDAPDRPLWTEGAPRRLTWSQLDAAASAVASRLLDLGLTSDSVVAIQGPNASDCVIAILACLKANLIPAPMPANWRNAEAREAISRIGGKAIFAATRAGSAHPADALRYVAAENFAVRFVCGFGAETPDGVVPFEDCIADPQKFSGMAGRGTRIGNPAEHVAIATWDCGSHGYFPVARSHNECLAAGLPVIAALELDQSSVLLATLSPCNFAGLATGLIPWLTSGCTLALHQAFDATVFGVQLERHTVTHVVLPQVAAECCYRESAFAGTSVRRVASIVRRPDLPSASAGAPVGAGPQLVELAVLGELALVAGSGRIDGGPMRLPVRPVKGGDADARAGIELRVDEGRVLRVRGPMVPRAGYPGPDRGAAFPLVADGWVSTQFPAVAADDALLVDGPRNDVIAIGGHTLSIAALDSLYADMPGAMAVNAVAEPDPILGQRLLLQAVPEAGASLSAVSLAMHAEGKSASPLAMSADAAIGDRRRATRLAGAA